jgi:hypothetical protein
VAVVVEEHGAVVEPAEILARQGAVQAPRVDVQIQIHLTPNRRARTPNQPRPNKFASPRLEIAKIFTVHGIG